MGKNINENTKIEKVAVQLKKIKENPIIECGIMPAIRCIPYIGDMIDTSTSRALDEFQKKKQEKLIESILARKERITSDAVNNVEFIVNFSKTLEAVRRLATFDKIEYFGNLICNGYFREVKIDNDVFEEYVGALNELSFRELQYLAFFKTSIAKEKNNQLNWKKFKSIFAEKFSIDQKLVYNIFYRLKRTGFVDETLILGSSDVSGDEDSGYALDSTDIDSEGFFLTKAFDEFYNMITDNS